MLRAGCVAITDVQAQAIQNQPMTLAEALVVLTAAVQTRPDTTAQDSGYDSIASCASYINSGVEQWAADATAAIAWRDAVWQACFTQWRAAKSETNPVIPDCYRTDCRTAAACDAWVDSACAEVLSVEYLVEFAKLAAGRSGGFRLRSAIRS